MNIQYNMIIAAAHSELLGEMSLPFIQLQVKDLANIREQKYVQGGLSWLWRLLICTSLSRNIVLLFEPENASTHCHSLHFVSYIRSYSEDYGCISHIYLMLTCGENTVVGNIARV